MAIVLSGLFAAAALLLPATAHAQNVWCQFVLCGGGGPGATGVSIFLRSIGLELITMMIGLVSAYVIYTAFIMVIQSSSDGASKGKESLRSIIVGCVVVALASTIVLAFGLGSGSTSNLNSELEKVVVFFRGVLYAALVANIVLQGFRYISSQGESGQMDKARQRLFASFIGTGLVLLTDTIITVASGNSAQAIPEAVGIAKYLITIFGGLCVIAILVAGILLVVSIDEGLKDKAKAAVKVAIFSLIIVILSAAIVKFFFEATPQ